MFKKIVIFGVGLIGGSVALALKKLPNPPHITGVGRSNQSLQEALSLGLIDSAETDIAIALENADLILIATPVAQTPAILKSILPHLAAQTVITDAGSTKSDVMAYAEAELGEQFKQFVGGHPIAGAEKSGPAAAMADLYIGKNVILTPGLVTDPEAVLKVTELWKVCGALVSNMRPEEHDSVFAAVSHLPHLLAFALVEDLAKRDNAELLFKFAASGFRDFTRIAGSHPEMWRDIALANKQALLQELNTYQQAIGEMTALLENNDHKGLFALFEHASHARNAWAKSKIQ
ncbi:MULTISPECIES: prephenate dehydrogenase/arogenate dehydrogenase family protein [unclassified Methylophilus]|uniref:prephenate dehydrogenase n=1 Tax=unclassified Methylophilus TaxID=2630143 RepID=UPI0006FD57B4|nr:MULTISPECIES: prephenate dehydrogenase/arogenate dehydrogenase family protein [unclassified Methylophilus]KQT37381.1 prephenate dehydrogenase [Methylophilus sp. Leaf416]KQT55450.1 prephenate dehydrogenase [Methylophilus sp. Leaf459]